MNYKDYNKVLNIQDGTIGNIEEVLSFSDFKVNINPDLSLGDFLLLRRIKTILEDGHDVILKYGYRNI